MAVTTVIGGSNAFLFKKVSSSYVMVGCVNEYNISLEAGTEEVNCDSNGIIPETELTKLSGTLDLKGVHKRYTSTDDTNNISIEEWITDLQAGTKSEIYIGEANALSTGVKYQKVYGIATKAGIQYATSKVGSYDVSMKLLPLPSDATKLYATGTLA